MKHKKIYLIFSVLLTYPTVHADQTPTAAPATPTAPTSAPTQAATTTTNPPPAVIVSTNAPTPAQPAPAVSAQPSAATTTPKPQTTPPQTPPAAQNNPAQKAAPQPQKAAHTDHKDTAKIAAKTPPPVAQKSSPAPTVAQPGVGLGPVVVPPQKAATPQPQPKTPTIPPLPPAPVIPTNVMAQATATNLIEHPLPPKKNIGTAPGKADDAFREFRNLVAHQNVDTIARSIKNPFSITPNIITPQMRLDTVKWLVTQSGLSINDKIILLFKLAQEYNSPTDTDMRSQFFNMLTSPQFHNADPVLYVAAQKELPLKEFNIWRTTALAKNPQSPLANWEIKAFEKSIQAQDPKTFTALRQYYSLPKNEATRLLWLVVNSNNKPDFIPLLKSMNADVNAIQNKQDLQTPLMHAAENGNLGLVTKLIDAGANPALKDHFGKKAIDIAQDKKEKASKEQQTHFIDIMNVLEQEKNLKK